MRPTFVRIIKNQIKKDQRINASQKLMATKSQ